MLPFSVSITTRTIPAGAGVRLAAGPRRARSERSDINEISSAEFAWACGGRTMTMILPEARPGEQRSLSSSARAEYLQRPTQAVCVLAYLNGSFLPRSAATISVEDRGFVFGDGVYEVWRVVNGRLFETDRHLARLVHGLGELRIDVARACSSPAV